MIVLPNRDKRMGLSILLNLMIISLIMGCSHTNEKSELVSLGIESIERIDVANGTTGEFILLEDESTYHAVLQLIQANDYILRTDEAVEGWIIGVRIYSNGKHYWFTPNGVDGYRYENPDFFKELLRTVSEEKEILFIK